MLRGRLSTYVHCNTSHGCTSHVTQIFMERNAARKPPPTLECFLVHFNRFRSRPAGDDDASAECKHSGDNRASFMSGKSSHLSSSPSRVNTRQCVVPSLPPKRAKRALLLRTQPLPPSNCSSHRVLRSGNNLHSQPTALIRRPVLGRLEHLRIIIITQRARVFNAIYFKGTCFMNGADNAPVFWQTCSRKTFLDI